MLSKLQKSRFIITNLKKLVRRPFSTKESNDFEE